MKLNFSLDDLAFFLENSDSLETLDISGNDLRPMHFVKLLKVIAFNKTLHNLNLSWNKLLDMGGIDENKHFLDQYFTKMSINELIENNMTNHFIYRETLDNIKMKEIPQLVIESICNLVRYNLSIQSINLDATGLPTHVLVGFVPGLRHAKSLLCFHLAQNPGINTRVKDYYRDRLKIEPRGAQLVIDINRDRDDLYEPLTKA